MCGRYTRHHSKQLKQRYNLNGNANEKLLAELKDRYNIAPSQTDVVIIMGENGEPQLVEMRWGYMPFWAKDIKDVIKYKTFNARSEEIFEKRTWKDAIKYRRCLIPSTGFYEWQKRDDGKQPFLIKPKAETIFSFAGLYGKWEDLDGVEWQTFSIITTTPNNQMESIHNRMPVILDETDEMTWIDPSLDDATAIGDLMKPYGDDELELFEVSREVNGARSDDKSFIIPLNSK